MEKYILLKGLGGEPPPKGGEGGSKRAQRRREGGETTLNERANRHYTGEEVSAGEATARGEGDELPLGEGVHSQIGEGGELPPEGEEGREGANPQPEVQCEPPPESANHHRRWRAEANHC